MDFRLFVIRSDRSTRGEMEIIAITFWMRNERHNLYGFHFMSICVRCSFISYNNCNKCLLIYYLLIIANLYTKVTNIKCVFFYKLFDSSLNNVRSWIKKTPLDNIMLVCWIMNSVELPESCKLWNILNQRLGVPSLWLNLILNA